MVGLIASRKLSASLLAKVRWIFVALGPVEFFEREMEVVLWPW